VFHGLKVGIVGAGIGGLTAAIALQKIGMTVIVYEQAEQLGEVGAGLTISKNAARVFDSLGLGSQLAALGKPCPHMGVVDHITGKVLVYEPLDKKECQSGNVIASRQVHRADLHDLLTAAIARPNNTIRLDHELLDITQDSTRVKLSFTKGQVDYCDIVIGADGLKSAVRELLYSAKPAKFTGFVAWRGLVERSLVQGLKLDPHFATYSSSDKLFVRYPVRHGSLINYVGIARKNDFLSESWKAPAKVTEVAAEFSGWYQDVPNIILATPKNSCMRWALYTRGPLQDWIRGRVCLLGDAAHPLTPFFGMGAAMAIEDSLILARCFESEKDNWQNAFKRYQRARLERCNHMQHISLQRAESYMNNDPARRAMGPSSGLGKAMDYDPRTAII
jgi:salicylate hydroxylase